MGWMTKRRLWTAAALAIGLAMALPSLVHAYYDDTHYSFTYFMARACGFTPMQ